MSLTERFRVYYTGCRREKRGNVPMRVIAVDYGDARTGVAVSDPTGTLAGETLTLRETGVRALAECLAEMARERAASRFVVGLPRNMNGAEGPRAEKTRAFATRLENASGLPVDFWDERLTTAGAQVLLREAGKNGPRDRGRVDAAAAALILEGYLRSQGGGRV